MDSAVIMEAKTGSTHQGLDAHRLAGLFPTALLGERRYSYDPLT